MCNILCHIIPSFNNFLTLLEAHGLKGADEILGGDFRVGLFGSDHLEDHEELLDGDGLVLQGQGDVVDGLFAQASCVVAQHCTVLFTVLQQTHMQGDVEGLC